MSDTERILDVRSLSRVGRQLGSNVGGIYEDAGGRQYYIKTLDSTAHARNEWLAARLYNLAGAPTLDYLRCSVPDQIATALIVLDKKALAQFDETERRQARHWLGVHAWLANWDAVGLHGENQGVADGRVLTLDVGGALEFRAGGDPKGRAFGDRVGELDSLRSNPDNPHAARLFGIMTPAEVQAAIQVVTRIPADLIRAVVQAAGGRPALADKLVARQADMAARLSASATPIPFATHS